jgi:hypothetical protein
MVLELTDEEVVAEIERLKKQVGALKKSLKKHNTVRISSKGAVSLYGLGRWPVTLYENQWRKVLDMKEELLTFIQENRDRLAKKEDCPILDIKDFDV